MLKNSKLFVGFEKSQGMHFFFTTDFSTCKDEYTFRFPIITDYRCLAGGVVISDSDHIQSLDLGEMQNILRTHFQISARGKDGMNMEVGPNVHFTAPFSGEVRRSRLSFRMSVWKYLRWVCLLPHSRKRYLLPVGNL